MNYTILIDDLLDGTLDSSQENRLFTELLSNPELRRELKQHIAIKTAIPNDRQAFFPTAQSANALFAKLNIQPGVVAVQPAAAAPKAGFLQRYRQGLLSGLGTFLVMSIIFLLLLSTGSLRSRDGSAIVTQAGSTEQAGVTEQAGTTEQGMAKPVDKSVPEPEIASEIIRKSGTGIRSLSGGMRPMARIQAVQAAPQNSVDAPLQPEQQELQPDISETDLLGIEAKMDTEESFTGNLYEAVPPPVYEYRSEDSFPALSLHIKNMAVLKLFPDRPLAESGRVFMNNTAFTLTSALGENFAWGAEIGRESLPLYLTLNSDEDSTAYLPQSSFLYGGAVARFTLFPFGSNFGVTSQLMAGATQPGPFGKLTLGLQYEITENLGMGLGLEGSGLLYRYQNQWNLTEKLSAVYSISVKLR